MKLSCSAAPTSSCGQRERGVVGRGLTHRAEGIPPLLRSGGSAFALTLALVLGSAACGSDSGSTAASEATGPSSSGPPSVCVALGAACPTVQGQACDGFCDTTANVCTCVVVNAMLEQPLCQVCCTGSHVVACRDDVASNYCGAGSAAGCDDSSNLACASSYVCRAD